MHHILDPSFEWNPPIRVEIIFLECAFFIGDLDCMTLLGNIHVLWLMASEFKLIL
jgi:hypothetical protein